MTKENLTGYVILLKNSKELVQTKRIRIYQREKLVDKFHFLVSYDYEEFNRESETKPDMSAFICVLQYIGADGTVHAEQLERMKDAAGEIVDYEDASGNITHMIYELPIDTFLTKLAGDITIKLNLQYTDYEGSTVSGNDDDPAPEPTPVQYVLNSDTTIITVLPVADYYSVVPDESLSQINNKIAELDTKLKELESTASTYDATKADSIKLDNEENEIYLTSGGVKVGESIALEDLSDEIVENAPEGLVTVIL